MMRSLQSLKIKLVIFLLCLCASGTCSSIAYANELVIDNDMPPINLLDWLLPAGDTMGDEDSHKTNSIKLINQESFTTVWRLSSEILNRGSFEIYKSESENQDLALGSNYGFPPYFGTSHTVVARNSTTARLKTLPTTIPMAEQLTVIDNTEPGFWLIHRVGWQWQYHYCTLKITILVSFWRNRREELGAEHVIVNEWAQYKQTYINVKNQLPATAYTHLHSIQLGARTKRFLDTCSHLPLFDWLDPAISILSNY